MYVVVDVETSYGVVSQYPWVKGAYLSTVCIQRNTGEVNTWVFNHSERKLDKTDKELVDEIQNELDLATTVGGHNLPFDLCWLRSIGINTNNMRFWDTALVEYLLSGQTWKMPSLDAVANKRLNKHKMDVVKNDYWDRGVATKDIPLSTLCAYNAEDCNLTNQIMLSQAKDVKHSGMMPLVKLKNEEIHSVVDIMQNGLIVNESKRKELEAEYTQKLEGIVKRITEIAGRRLNLDSPAQISALLYGGKYTVSATCYYEKEYASGIKIIHRKEKIRKNYKGLGFKPCGVSYYSEDEQYSTDKTNLIELREQAKTPEQKELLDLLTERSALAQLLKTYILGIKDKVHDGVVHCQLNQTVTATGRFSSSSPNLQNLPRENTAPVKQMFYPRNGWIVAGDTSGLEWRVAAFLSGCPVMKREILEGIDSHSATGSEIFNEKGTRTDWKVFNFRLIYKGSPKSFFLDPRMPRFTLKKWTQLVDAAYAKYYGLAKWQKENVQEVYRKDGVLRSITGRYFYFSKNKCAYGEQYRVPQIANYPVQSLATADLIPLAMTKIRQRLLYLSPAAVMCNQVHDDIMYDTTEEHIDIIAKVMLEEFNALPKRFEEHFGIKFDVPLTGEIKVGRCWGDMIKYT